MALNDGGIMSTTRGALVGRQMVRSQEYEEFNDAQKITAKLG